LFKKELKKLEDKIKSAPTEIIDIVNIRNCISQNEQKLLNYKKEFAEKKENNKKNKNKILKANEFIDNFDQESLTHQKKNYDDLELQLENIMAELRNSDEKMYRAEKQVKLLQEVPCGSEFSHCKFISGAYEAKEEISLIHIGKNSNELLVKSLQGEMGYINIGEVEKELQKFNELLKLKEDLENRIPTDELMMENISSKKSIIEHELKNFRDTENLYEDNKEVIEDLEGIIREKDTKKSYLSVCATELEECENALLELYKTDGYYKQKVENLQSEKNKCEKLKNDYEAHELYMKCMHPNGIAYNIIKKSLPTINSEISKILANIVDFQVYFETDDNRLDIYIQQPDRDASPLEMASGAEKTIAAMAIRLAFTNISSLPKSQLFILDEPGTALDADRMEGFVRILDITSSIFKTVILISHLDNLKDAADSIINIEKKDGYANVTA